MSIHEKILKFFQNQKVRYLIAGGWNTLFGYVISLILYGLLRTKYHIVLISILANIIAITSAFILYKFYVFKTKGNYLKEYLRIYLTYGLSAILGILAIWILVDKLRIEFWIAQSSIMFFMIIFTYLFNSRYTFKLK